MAEINRKNIIITAQMLTMIAELDEFKGAWSGLERLRPEQLKALRRVSTIESVGSSNRIEGNKLSDLEVEKLLSNIEIKTFKSRDEEEVAGYAELMNTIFDNYSIIPLSENYIKQLHLILLRYVGKDQKHRGEYKKIPNSIVAFDQDGNEKGLIFETATTFDTPRFMEELMEWTRKNIAEGFFHPLIVIGIFIVHFLAIHPFQDGNGRLSRVLTAMLLLQKGYTYIPYASLESFVEASKEGYYSALRKTQKDIWAGKPNYEPWLSYFLTTLIKHKRHLENKFQTMTIDDTRLGKNARCVLALFDEKPEWSVSDVAKTLELNINTCAKTIKMLVHNGYLIKQGTTKGAWYERIK